MHEGEGFKCANEAVMKVLGTSTMPITIQRYVGKAHVHVVDNLPEGIDVILGSDWMKKNRTILDYDRMVMVVKAHNCTLTPANRVATERPKSFFRMALDRAKEVPEDPEEEARSRIDPRVTAKQAWRDIKKGRDFVYVNVRESRSSYPSPVTKKEEASMLPTLPCWPGGQVPVKTNDGSPGGHGVPAPRVNGNLPAGSGGPGPTNNNGNKPAGPVGSGPGRIPEGSDGPLPTETRDELPGPPKKEPDFEAWLLENIPEHDNPNLIPASRLRELLLKYRKVFN